MKSVVTVTELVAVIVAIDAQGTGTKAEAASPRCVALYNSWRATQPTVPSEAL